MSRLDPSPALRRSDMPVEHRVEIVDYRGESVAEVGILVEPPAAVARRSDTSGVRRRDRRAGRPRGPHGKR